MTVPGDGDAPARVPGDPTLGGPALPQGAPEGDALPPMGRAPDGPSGNSAAKADETRLPSDAVAVEDDEAATGRAPATATPAAVASASLRGAPDTPDFVARFRDEIAGQKADLATEPEARAEFYVFFSFDLVNSTLYKTLYRSAWPLVTQRFYEVVEDSLRKHIAGVRLWKYVGDELLLYLRVRRHQDLRRCLLVAAETLERAIDTLRQEAPGARTVLSVKATVWCAQVHELPPKDLRLHEALDASGARKDTAPRYTNIIVRQASHGGVGQVDFLGPEIDIGFRIARYASRGRMVVSADLAYLLYRDRASNDDIERQLKIVGYEQLKGVWGNRHYPIFWYERDWTRVRSSFEYDEHFQNETVRRIRASKDGEISGDLRDIVKVYGDLDRTRDADALWQFVLALDEAADADPAPLTVNDAKEVHCVAVCFRQDGRALVARRSTAKRRYPGHWEFGCGQLAPYETFADCLRRAYEEDFGAQLDVPDSPIPVDTYVIEDRDETRSIPGIIFVAGVLNPEDVRARKHERIDWVDPQNPGPLAGAECVPDLMATLRRAAEVWERSRRRVTR